jgi:hypothetical protein
MSPPIELAKACPRTTDYSISLTIEAELKILEKQI